MVHLHKALVALCLMFCAAAHAQWPTEKPIRFVVPFPAGSSPDILARTLTEALSKTLNQTIIVDNKPGAGGNIGTRFVAQAANDGYTFLYTINGPLVTAPRLFKKTLGYEPETDFDPVMLVANSPNVLVVAQSFPANNVDEFVAAVKAKPGHYNYGAVGLGSASHLAMARFMKLAGLDMHDIQYSGFNQITLALLAGDLHTGFMVPAAITPHIKTGKLKALGISSAQVQPTLPDLSPIASLGYSNFEVMSWNAILAPAGTAPNILLNLHQALVKVLNQEPVRQQFQAQYFAIVGSTPTELKALMRLERKAAEQLIDELKLSLE